MDDHVRGSGRNIFELIWRTRAFFYAGSSFLATFYFVLLELLSPLEDTFLQPFELEGVVKTTQHAGAHIFVRNLLLV